MRSLCRIVAVGLFIAYQPLLSGQTAQTQTTVAGPTKPPANASDGVKITGQSVHDSVRVTATILSWDAVKRDFGKEVANTYAVVQLVIANKSVDSDFVLQTVALDTSQWALGGTVRPNVNLDNRWDASHGIPAHSLRNQISSVEARIVRGQLLDAQTWTARNWTVRILTLVGSVAAASLYAIPGDKAGKGVAAFTGTVVPGVAVAWPDGAIAHANNVSDYGYRTNKVIGRGSSDVVVCFFPIEMFLSEPFQQIFYEHPGFFVSPYQLLYTPENRPLREKFSIKATEGSLKKPDAAMATATPEQLAKMTKDQSDALLQQQKNALAAQAAANEVEKARLAAKPQSGKSGSTLKEEEGIDKLRRLHGCYSKLFEAVGDSPRPPTAATPGSKEVEQAVGGWQDLQGLDDLLRQQCVALLKANPEDTAMLDYIGRFGAENIIALVDGIMSVDAAVVPATIDDVVFEGEPQPTVQAFWNASEKKEERKGSVMCRFCLGGTVTVVDGKAQGIEVTNVQEGSDEHKLNFRLSLSKTLDPGTVIKFQITKHVADPKDGAGNGKDVKSGIFQFIVPAYTPATPVIKSMDQSGSSIVLTGANLVSTTAHPLKIVLTRSSPSNLTRTVGWPAGQPADKTNVDLPADLERGCWQPVVNWTNTANVTEVIKPATALVIHGDVMAITSAKLDSNTIKVIGDNFVDTTACKGSLPAFVLIDDKGNATDLKVEIKSPTELALTSAAPLPAGVLKINLKGASNDKAVGVDR